MVINKQEKRPEIPTEYESRERSIKELSKKSTGVLALAVTYAEFIEKTGIDLKRAWETVEEKQKDLQEIYNRGYEDGFHLRKSLKIENRRPLNAEEREKKRG